MRLGLIVGLGLALLTGAAAADSMDEIRAGNAAFGDGRYQEAVDAFTRAIIGGDLSPEALAVTFNNRGVAFSELGDFARAIEDYNQALSLKPGDPTAVKNLRIGHTRRAAARADAGAVAEAIADYAQAIELQPDHPLAYVRRGQLRLLHGDSKAGLADLEAAQRLEPANADISRLLAEARGRLAQLAATAPRPDPAPVSSALPATPPPVTAAPVGPAPAPPPEPPAAPPPATAAPASPAPAPPRETAARRPAPAPSADGAGGGDPFRATTDVNMRAGPGNSYASIGSVGAGERVLVTGEELGWKRIRLRNGTVGFVYRKWLEPDEQ